MDKQPLKEPQFNPGSCFPVTKEAVLEGYNFFMVPSDPLDAHLAVVEGMIVENPFLLDVMLDIGISWDMTDEQQVGFTGGLAVGYKILQVQSAMNRAELPVVSMEVANTFVVDLNQSGGKTAGRYVAQRSDELEFEDPYYHEALRLAMAGHVESGRNDQGYMTMLGGIFVYDLIKKQAFAEDFSKQLSDDI